LTNSYHELPRHFVDALGVRTAYYTAGKRNGRPLVLLHGMTSSGDVYREMMHELAAEFWLIAPDIPGFGHSEMTQPYTLAHLVEWLAAFQDALTLPPMILVGHSFGGALAAHYTLSDPEDVERLLLVAPAIISPTQMPDLLMKAGISLGLVDLGTAVSQSSRAIIKRQVKTPVYNADSIDDTVWERHVEEYILSQASANVLKALAFKDIRPLLMHIQQPVAIVWGKNDPVLPITDADELAELRPDWQVVKLDDCGHIPPLEKQREFQAITRRFINNQPVELSTAAIQRVISVFGSSAPTPGSETYAQAQRVGQLLAEKGYAVATGGYMGTMMAVSQGASEAGGHVIGVTSAQIERFRPIAPNRFVQEEIRYESLRERLVHLVTENIGVITLPGGIGTLSEVSLAWSFLQTGEMPLRPIVLLGRMWRDSFAPLTESEYVQQKYADLLFYAGTPETAVNLVTNYIPLIDGA